MTGPLRSAAPAPALGPRAGDSGFSRRETLTLALALVRRDLALHHRHTRLGILWGVVPPLLAVGVLDLFLGRVAGVARSVSGVPYPVFLYSGLLAWQFLARAASSGAGSVVSNGWVVTQVQFPRIVLPLSHVATGALDFALGSVGMLLWTLVAGPAPGPQLFLWPAAVAALFLLSLALAVVLSAAAVFLRDVLPAAPYAMQVLFVASPVLYPLSAAEGHIPRALLLANPATGMLETFRSAWLGTPLDVPALLASLAISVALLGLGCAWFQRVECRFADRL